MSDDVQNSIGEAVKANDVLLFMKGTPTFPQCGFSSVVVQVLDYLGVEYQAVNVLEDQAVREGIKTFSDWPNHSAALCQRRICWRLRHHQGDV